VDHAGELVVTGSGVVLRSVQDFQDRVAGGHAGCGVTEVAKLACAGFGPGSTEILQGIAGVLDRGVAGGLIERGGVRNVAGNPVAVLLEAGQGIAGSGSTGIAIAGHELGQGRGAFGQGFPLGAIGEFGLGADLAGIAADEAGLPKRAIFVEVLKGRSDVALHAFAGSEGHTFAVAAEGRVGRDRCRFRRR